MSSPSVSLTDPIFGNLSSIGNSGLSSDHQSQLFQESTEADSEHQEALAATRAAIEANEEYAEKELKRKEEGEN